MTDNDDNDGAKSAPVSDLAESTTIPVQQHDACLPSRQVPDDRSAARDIQLRWQLELVSGRSGYGPELGKSMSKATLDLYHELEPRDAIDSMLAEAMVGISNLTMASIADGMASSSLAGKEISCRYAIKGTAMLMQLAEFYESRRGRAPRRVSVGTVNVESGGQAIVGAVDTGHRQNTLRGAPKSKRQNEE